MTALNPFGPTFDSDNQQDVKKRPRGPTQKVSDPSKPQEYLGVSSGFGFTKKNELFVGRVAMLVSTRCSEHGCSVCVLAGSAASEACEHWHRNGCWKQERAQVLPSLLGKGEKDWSECNAA